MDASPQFTCRGPTLEAARPCIPSVFTVWSAVGPVLLDRGHPGGSTLQRGPVQEVHGASGPWLCSP